MSSTRTTSLLRLRRKRCPSSRCRTEMSSSRTTSLLRCERSSSRGSVCRWTCGARIARAPGGQDAARNARWTSANPRRAVSIVCWTLIPGTARSSGTARLTGRTEGLTLGQRKRPLVGANDIAQIHRVASRSVSKFLFGFCSRGFLFLFVHFTTASENSLHMSERHHMLDWVVITEQTLFLQLLYSNAWQ